MNLFLTKSFPLSGSPNKKLQEFAAKEKLEIVASLSEAQTAKEPVKNVGSNFMLNSKQLEISPKNGWRARVAGEPMTSFPNWRKREDSNLRYPFGYNGFQDHPFKPLRHASILSGIAICF